MIEKEGCEFDTWEIAGDSGTNVRDRCLLPLGDSSSCSAPEEPETPVEEAGTGGEEAGYSEELETYSEGWWS